MSDIERLRVVVTVARTHSISEAAREHRIAQSTVTRAVAAAEELVGFALFQRTAAGAQLAAGARAAIAKIEQVVASFDELRSLGDARPAGIRIAHLADLQVPGRVADPVVRWNRERTPTAAFVVDADPIAAVRSGEAECALVRTDGPCAQDLEAVVVQVTRLDRTELLYRPAPSAELATFTRLF